jgi:DnaK suppressor protein
MPINASELTDTQLKQLKATLEKKLADLTHEIRELEATVTRDDADGKDAPDEVDRSSFEEEMQRMQLVLDGKNQLQYEVINALKRLEDGNYGVCEESEEPIGFKRLMVQPWTRFSVEAQQEMEERRRNSATASGSYSTSSSYDQDEADE